MFPVSSILSLARASAPWRALLLTSRPPPLSLAVSSACCAFSYRTLPPAVLHDPIRVASPRVTSHSSLHSSACSSLLYLTLLLFCLTLKSAVYLFPLRDGNSLQDGTIVSSLLPSPPAPRSFCGRRSGTRLERPRALPELQEQEGMAGSPGLGGGGTAGPHVSTHM